MRIKYSVPRHKRKKRIFKLSKGYYSDKSHRLRMAMQQVKKSLTTAYEHRKDRKGDLRQLWITRINAATRQLGMTYGELIHGLKKANIAIDRKMLAEMAVNDGATFKKLAKSVKSTAAGKREKA